MGGGGGGGGTVLAATASVCVPRSLTRVDGDGDPIFFGGWPV